MTTQENKAIVRRYFEEVLSGRDIALADDLLAEELDTHGRFPGQRAGREGLKEVIRSFHGACPDLDVKIEDMLAEGDRVATRWSAAGTVEADLFGIAPGGQELILGGIVIHRLAEGRIVEQWAGRDDLSWMGKLGLVHGLPEPHAR